jgi:hypothetical protein
LLLDFKTEVLNKLEAITIALQEHGSMLSTIMSQFDTRNNEAELHNEFQFESGLFPLKSLDQIQNLEQMLLTAAPKSKLVRINKI